MGLGTQDSLDLARRFVEETGTTFTMLWAPTPESWNHYGIRNNSDFHAVDRSGARIGGRFSGLDEAHIEALLADA